MAAEDYGSQNHSTLCRSLYPAFWFVTPVLSLHWLVCLSRKVQFLPFSLRSVVTLYILLLLCTSCCYFVHLHTCWRCNWNVIVDVQELFKASAGTKNNNVLYKYNYLKTIWVQTFSVLANTTPSISWHFWTPSTKILRMREVW